MTIFLLLAAVSTPLPKATLTDDIRCVTVMSMLRSTPLPGDNTPDIRRAVDYGELYYLGRIDGRAPDIDLGAAMATARKALIADGSMPAVMKSCSLAMSKRMEAVGTSIEAASQKEPQASRPAPK